MNNMQTIEALFARMATAVGDARPKTPTSAPGTSRPRHSSSSKAKGGKFDIVNIDGLQNFLKLRTKLSITDQLSAEVGADWNVRNNNALPQAALFYEILRGKENELGQKKHFGTLRMTLDRIAIRKPFDLQREKWGGRLNVTAGSTFDGTPEIGFDVDKVRPAWALLIPAAVIFLAGKPLAGSRSFGTVRTRLPWISEDAVGRGEGMGKLTRKGNGLQIGISQLNGVLRL
ncbi:hypothetical protein WJX73_008609 [Symbiochloris irregularis]|uniref:Uncharacterized protein n=1 Tax=Symbiochloris irregularis TaxID=706552 RepID=A0AAW1Q2V3_9CHLO